MDNDAAAAEAHSQLDALLEATTDAVFATSLDGRLNLWSRAAENLFGYNAGEVLGQSGAMLVSPRSASLAVEVRRIISIGRPVDSQRIACLSADGDNLDLLIEARPVFDAHGAVSGALFLARSAQSAGQEKTRDDVDGALAELQASAQTKALILETANRVALDILANRTGIEALRHIADAARILAGARYAALGVARPEAAGLSEFITVGLTASEEAAIGPLPRGRGVLGLLLERTEPLRIDRLGEHPASVGFPAGHPPMDSFLGVPIRRGDTILGSLYLTNKQAGVSFTEADEIAVQALGAHAAVAIHNLHTVQRQRSLLSGLMTAQEEERRAVAYDLHDGLTQYVMAAHAHLESFQRAGAAGNSEKAERDLATGLNYLKEAVIESRRLVNGLRSLALDDLGLAGALEQLVAEEKERAGWESADFVHNLAGCRFDKSLETGAYRVAQEALTNVRKHANAARVSVVLLREELDDGSNRLRLEVRDWGSGFVAPATLSAHQHVGLQGIAERVYLLGGRYELRSTPGEGTTLTAAFPIMESSDTEESE